MQYSSTTSATVSFRMLSAILAPLVGLAQVRDGGLQSAKDLNRFAVVLLGEVAVAAAEHKGEARCSGVYRFASDWFPLAAVCACVCMSSVHVFLCVLCVHLCVFISYAWSGRHKHV